MRRSRCYLIAAALLPVFALTASCAKKEEQAEKQPRPAAEETISYLDEEISFGLYFDEAGTQRTLNLSRGQDEFTAYLILTCPEYMQIKSVEWRLEMPEGVEIINDRYHRDRLLSLGRIQTGLSESFKPCLQGPRIILNALTFHTSVELSDAEFSVMPSLKGEFLGIAECREGYPTARGISYRAVVNPVSR